MLRGTRDLSAAVLRPRSQRERWHQLTDLPCSRDVAPRPPPRYEVRYCFEWHPGSASYVDDLELACGDQLVRQRPPDAELPGCFGDREQDGFRVEERRLLHTHLSARGSTDRANSCAARSACGTFAPMSRGGSQVRVFGWWGVGEECSVDDVGEPSFERSECFGVGVAHGGSPLEVGLSVGV